MAVISRKKPGRLTNSAPLMPSSEYTCFSSTTDPTIDSQILTLQGSGDVHVDTHHLVEDTGIVLGQALSTALGDRDGIARFGSAYAPLDEALARVVLDLGKRPFLSYNVPLRGRIGSLESEVIEEFWKALTIHLGATIHVDVIRGRNRHHMAEATFKALGLALRAAMTAGPGPGVPSSKGLLG